MQEMWVRSLGREDPLAKGMETHSSILAWEMPWTEEEPDGLQSIGSQRVRHDLVTEQQQENSQVIKSLPCVCVPSKLNILCLISSYRELMTVLS